MHSTKQNKPVTYLTMLIDIAFCAKVQVN